MKIAIIHNEYGTFSGEEAVVASQVELLEAHGHGVCRFTRSSSEIAQKKFGKLQALCSGIYNPFSVRSFRRFLADTQPDLIHIHNLFPFISPAILHVCKEFKLPVVMTLHNYRLLCPNGLFLTKGAICEKCCGSREWQCVLNNCENSLGKSLGYALRNTVARIRKSYIRHVHVFAALTDFQRQKLIQEGYPATRIQVVPNMSQPVKEIDSTLGEYIGYVGRVSPEKGVQTLLEAATDLPQFPFQAAGGYEKTPELVGKAPPNFRFKGHLPHKEIASFMAQSRIIVLCSTWYEGFPIILVEAMLHGKPVIASRLGGIPEIVDDGKTGLLFEAGNSDDLAEKIKCLWDNPKLCRRMGEAGRKKAFLEYSQGKYYNRLMETYDLAWKTIAR